MNFAMRKIFEDIFQWVKKRFPAQQSLELPIGQQD